MSEAAVLEKATQRNSVAPMQNRLRSWIVLTPLILLPVIVLALRAKLFSWIFMWLLAAAIFAGCKWLTWWPYRRMVTSGGTVR